MSPYESIGPQSVRQAGSKRGRREQREAEKWFFEKLRHSAYGVGRDTDDRRDQKRAILNIAEAVREEDPDGGKHLSREYCDKTAIQVFEWVWLRSGTWRHPERRHQLTREECRLGGQRSRSPRRVPDEKRAEIRRLRAEGVKRSEVAQRFRVSEKTVTRICQEQGTVTGLGGEGLSFNEQYYRTLTPPKPVAVPSSLETPNRGPRLPRRVKTSPKNAPRPPETAGRTVDLSHFSHSGRRHMLHRLYRRAPFTPADAEQMDRWAETATKEELWTAIRQAQHRVRFDGYPGTGKGKPI